MKEQLRQIQEIADRKFISPSGYVDLNELVLAIVEIKSICDKALKE